MEGKVLLKPSNENTTWMWMCTAGHCELEQRQNQARINKNGCVSGEWRGGKRQGGVANYLSGG